VVEYFSWSSAAGALGRGGLSAPRASRFWARAGNAMGLIDFLWL